MHRIDAPGHSSNMFTDGNPSLGTPSTRIWAKWLNNLQEEICTVIAAADSPAIALDSAQNGQLLAAILDLINDAGGVPDATDTVKGKVELATNAETIAGTDAVRAVVPTGLAAALALYAKLNSAPTFTGQVTAPSFNTSSSRRWKSNIKALEPAQAIQKLMAIQLVSYISEKTHSHHVGVIAEQLVEAGLSAHVRFDDEGLPTAVDYQSLFMLAMSAVQDQEARIQRLERLVLVEGAR